MEVQTNLWQQFDIALLDLAVGPEVDVSQLGSGEHDGVGWGDQGKKFELLRLVVQHLRLGGSKGVEENNNLKRE